MNGRARGNHNHIRVCGRKWLVILSPPPVDGFKCVLKNFFSRGFEGNKNVLPSLTEAAAGY